MPQKQRLRPLLEIAKTFARGLPLSFSSFTAFSHQMFLGKSDELASVFSHQNKPVFNVEDVEKYGFGAIPECCGKINFMTKCVRSILSKVRSVEHSHRNICEISRDLFVSTIFRALSANGNPEVLTCSPALTSNAAQPPAATVKSSSFSIDILSLTHPAGWNGRHACKLPTAFLPLRRPPSAFFSRSWPGSHAPRRSCNRHANVTAQPLSDACLNRSVCRCGEINWHALSFKAVVSEFVCKSG